MDQEIIKAAKMCDKVRSKKYYEANKERIKEKYNSLTPEQKHERTEKARKKRYILKHGSLEGYEPWILGAPRPYKSGYYLENREKILQQYKDLSEQDKILRRARSKKSYQKLMKKTSDVVSDSESTSKQSLE